MSRPPYAYQRTTAKARAKSDNPEARLQKAVVAYLSYALPRGQYRVRAGLEGAKRTGASRTDFHAMGAAPGWPDLMLFNRTTRAIRWIELKSDTGRVQASQAEIHAELRDHVRVCRNLEEVESALLSWGVVPQCPIDKAHRYALPDGL